MNRFYLACLRDTVGTNVSFHCKDGCGYSTDISKAHEYTREEAQRAWDRGREFDLPLCASRVDDLAILHVDCQHIPVESVIPQDCSKFVAYKEGAWDGNDVYWLDLNFAPNTNFSQVQIFARPIASKGWIWLPFETADAAKRWTFSVDKINKRKMVQAAGLVTPDHIKRARRRKSSGKTRWNCSGCGQIVWQHDPYQFHGCRNIKCDDFYWPSR